MYCVLAFILAVMSTIKGVPLVNLKPSDNLQSSSTIFETLDIYFILDTMDFTCETNVSTDSTHELLNYYCQDLIKKNGIYLSLKNIKETKINGIQTSLVKFLNLQNKAIVCRGMRHLLPIIMYGIFINNTINGSTGNVNSGIDTFEELFKKKSDFLNDENVSIEKKFQQLKALTIKNGRTNKKLDERPEQSNGEFAATFSGFMDNIITTVQLILPFIEKLDCFHNLYKIYEVTTASKSDRDLLLLLIFDEVKIMYRTECYADIDAAALLQNRDGGLKFELNYESIPLLVKEIDRLFVAIQKYLQFLFELFLSENDPKRSLQQYQSVSILFYHTFKKFHDPEVWKLIGNEIIVDHSFDPAGKAVATSINVISSNLIKRIQGTAHQLTALITKQLRCRCFMYLNLLMKLYYCSVRVLVANVREVGRSVQKLEQIDQHNNYSLLHNKIKSLWIDKCNIGDDVGVIDELLNRDGIDKYFRSAYAAYWNQNAQSVGMAIENIWDYSLDIGFMPDFGPFFKEIGQIQAQHEIELKSVESLVNRYKWTERVYKDQCFSGEYDDYVFTFSENLKRAIQVTTYNTAERLTLGWLMTTIDTLNDDLINDLDLIYNIYYISETN